MRKRALIKQLAIVLVLISLLPATAIHRPRLEPAATSVPTPLLAHQHSVDWWFVFKLNASKFPDCGGAARGCPFGGTVETYKVGQQYVFASSESPTLKQGAGCAGDTGSDPIGATFEQVYNGAFHYLIWNDQFYNDPQINGCSGNSCSAPWGHSKGMLVWNDDGNGFVLQVTTPSWPASGSKTHPRMHDGNTLGCIDDDNVLVSQHFFALKLNKQDVIDVLHALQNASVVTDPTNLQIVSNGGPSDVQDLVNSLGKKSQSADVVEATLSTGVKLISKPSNLNVPAWQMVSATLGGVSLRTATWWANPKIPTTTSSTTVKCWSTSLSKPGAVEIATTGEWDDKEIGLTGGAGPNFNHAKIGVTTSGAQHLAIFGDMNQQGSLSGPNCKSSQNGRGGLFYVVNNEELSGSVAALIKGKTAPTTLTTTKPKTTKKKTVTH
jgi:Deoxyribonuclease II